MNESSRDRSLVALAVVLGIFSFATILAFHNITDGDLWAKLALGASVWLHGDVLRHDIFAFTPTLPDYIDHEWGAGVIFYGAIKLFGPCALQVLKILLALGTLMASAVIGRKQNVSWTTLLLLAIPAALCVSLGFIPVIRSHAFTYFFFAVILLCLEELKSKTWPMFVLPVVMLFWANIHGGFAAGLGTVAVYLALRLLRRKKIVATILLGVACVAVTFISPYGIKFWQYLLPALLHKRAQIGEWQPLSAWGQDDYIAFRILFVATVAVICVAWKKTEKKSWGGLIMLAITAILTWRSRRHAPFFGITVLAFAGPYYEAAFSRLASSDSFRRLNGLVGALGVYVALAFFVAMKFLPGASFQPLAPVGHDPVREADILSLANAKGNLVAPFGAGSYLAWRLFPNIKISMDGRYEAAYPESTFQMNNDFFEMHGDWQKIIRDYKVDYVIIDLTHDKLRPADLIPLGYVLVWQQDDLSALLCRPEHAELLRTTVNNLPPTTIDPLDANIPKKWNWSGDSKR